MAAYELVVGLEVHTQLATKSKMFSSSRVSAHEPPNKLIDPVTLGLPGCLPVVNSRAIEFAVKLGLATNCSIRNESVFARKHYHYPDLPKGYQISQYDKPICEEGFLDVGEEDNRKRIGITRIHMEEDAGKSIHLDGEEASLVDLNRAGVPLLEVVSEPDLRSAEDAGDYVRQLRQIVRYLGICDGNMEEGSLRCDANISLRKFGEEKLGTKVEIKNLNSFRFIEKAIHYEAERQEGLLEQGEEIIQETRLWDEQRGISKPMRSKEFAEDYRYFPCPDLPPVYVSDEQIDRVRETLPELPRQVEERFISSFGLDAKTAARLSEEATLANYYDKAVAAHQNPDLIANWICTELFGQLNRSDTDFADCPISPENLAGLVKLIDTKVISGKIAKTVFEEMFASGGSPDAIVEQKGLKQISDSSEVQKIVRAVLDANASQVEEYKAGKTKVMGFLVGQVMKESKGKANPEMVNKLLVEMLKA